MTTVSPLPQAPRAALRSAARRRAHPLRTEAWRGSWALLVTVPLLWASLNIVLRVPGDAVSSWVSVHDALRSQGLLIGGPFAIAAGCWHGGRERRRGTDELFTSLPATQLRRTALAALPSVLWPVLAYGLSAAVCIWLGLTEQVISYGHPFSTLLAADAVAIGALGLLGFLAGRVIPWVLAGPVLAVVVGVGMGTLAHTYPAALRLPGADMRWLNPASEDLPPWHEPVWWFGLSSMLWFGGLATAALFAYAACRRLAALSLAAALAAGGVLVGTGDGLWRLDRGATALACDGGQPQVCMLRAHRPYLADISGVLAQLTARLRPIPNAPDRFVEVPIDDNDHPLGPTPGADGAALDVPAVNYREHTDMTARDAAESAAVFGCTDVPMPWAASTPVPEKYREAVAAWLTPAAGAPFNSDARPVLERLKALPDRERTAWLGDYFAAVRACQPERISPP